MSRFWSGESEQIIHNKLETAIVENALTISFRQHLGTKYNTRRRINQIFCFGPKPIVPFDSNTLSLQNGCDEFIQINQFKLMAVENSHHREDFWKLAANWNISM